MCIFLKINIKEEQALQPMTWPLHCDHFTHFATPLVVCATCKKLGPYQTLEDGGRYMGVQVGGGTWEYRWGNVFNDKTHIVYIKTITYIMVSVK